MFSQACPRYSQEFLKGSNGVKKNKCQTHDSTVNTSGTETIVNDIRDWGVLILILYKLMKLFDVKKLLQGAFAMTKNIFKHVYHISMFYFPIMILLSLPSIYYNAHPHQLPPSYLRIHWFWVGVNIFDVLFLPWVWACLIHYYKMTKKK